MLVVVAWSVACHGPRQNASDGAPSERCQVRAVVMAPSAAEAVAALGLDDCAVGVGDFVTWPTALAGRPKVGGHDAPNVERVLALGADVVFTVDGSAGRGAYSRLQQQGVRVARLQTSTFDGALDAIDLIGEELGRPTQAKALSGRIRATVAAVRLQAGGVPRRRVLLVVGHDPLYVAGPGSHLHYLAEVAGGANVAADLKTAYQLASLEAVLAKQPEVIIDVSDNRRHGPHGRHQGRWARFPFLPAVRDGRVGSFILTA